MALHPWIKNSCKFVCFEFVRILFSQQFQLSIARLQDSRYVFADKKTDLFVVQKTVRERKF